jgi:hypothetical protein
MIDDINSRNSNGFFVRRKTISTASTLKFTRNAKFVLENLRTRQSAVIQKFRCKSPEKWALEEYETIPKAEGFVGGYF